MIREHNNLKRLNIRSRHQIRIRKPSINHRPHLERTAQSKNLLSPKMAANLFHGMKLIAIAIASLSLLLLPLRDSFANEYLRADCFEKVFVTKEDTLTNIAARYTNDNGQRRKLAAAIAKVNDLDPTRPLPDGWHISIPLVK